jgi:hypothetical protein
MLAVAAVICFWCFADILGVTECLWEEQENARTSTVTTE